MQILEKALRRTIATLDLALSIMRRINILGEIKCYG